MKSFKQVIVEVKREYDISDWSEDGIDDIQQELDGAGAKHGKNKDYYINYKGKTVMFCFYTDKYKKIEKAYFKK